MALSNYGELTAALVDFAARNLAKWTSNIPVFVAYAHTEMMRDLRIPLLEVSTDLVIDAERVDLPADFRAVKSLWVDDNYDEPLSPATSEQRLRLIAARATGRPVIFTREAEQLAFGPRPDTAYSGKLLYYRELAAMTEDSDTNLILRRYPFAYMFGALAAAASFDKNTEEEAKYEAKFRAQIATINSREQADALGGGALVAAVRGAIA